MITDIPVSNRFQTRTDWQLKAFLCRKFVIPEVKNRIAIIINEETNVHPFLDKRYRGRNAVLSRHLFLVMMTRYTRKSYSDIGAIIGNDHATVSHAIKSVSDQYDTDKNFREIFDRIETRVKQIV